MFSIRSSRPVALAASFSSGSASNASTTPDSTAPTTPTSEASVIDFKLASRTKSRVSGFKTRFSKFRTSTKSLLYKTHSKLKQPGIEPSIFVQDSNDVRASVMEVVARFEEFESESGLNIPFPCFPSQVSLIPLHDGSSSHDFDAGTNEDANVDDPNDPQALSGVGFSTPRSLAGATSKALRQSPVILASRCLAAGWRYTLGCLCVCMALFAVYGLHWFLALPKFYALHPCSPMWLDLAVSHIRESQQSPGAAPSLD